MSQTANTSTKDEIIKKLLDRSAAIRGLIDASAKTELNGIPVYGDDAIGSCVLCELDRDGMPFSCYFSGLFRPGITNPIVLNQHEALDAVSWLKRWEMKPCAFFSEALMREIASATIQTNEGVNQLLKRMV